MTIKTLEFYQLFHTAVYLWFQDPGAKTGGWMIAPWLNFMSLQDKHSEDEISEANRNVSQFCYTVVWLYLILLNYTVKNG